MEKIDFTGMTGAQAFRAIDANGGVNDAEISVNMEAWARVSFFNQFDEAQTIAAITKFGNHPASYATTLAGHLQNCTEFDSELINEAAEELMRKDKEVKCMAEKIKALESELEAVGAGGVQPLRKVKEKDCPSCGSPNGKCLGKFSCTSQQLRLSAHEVNEGDAA